MENVGARIKAFREHRGLTQKDVAQATKGEIKQTSLSAIENNQAKPGFETLAALLQAYPDLSSEWLLLGHGAMLKTGETARVWAPPPPPEPAPDYTSAHGTLEAAYITVLKEQVADLKADKARLLEENQELRGKSFDSPDAAGPQTPMPTPPRAVVAGFVLSVQHRTRRGNRSTVE